MNVIRHDDVAPYRPSLNIVRLLGHLAKNLVKLIRDEKVSATLSASSDEINRRASVHPFEAAEMLSLSYHLPI